MYKMGLIGYGGMGGWHAKSLSSMPDFELAGVYDINPEKVKKAREAGFRGFDSLGAILADPDIRTVILAVPNNFHREIAEKSHERRQKRDKRETRRPQRGRARKND
jgi:scyllo-inositol 2-dehydrogenase (NADP+)